VDFMTPRELAAQWRADADVLDRHGATQLASTCRAHADALDAALRSEADDVLDLTTAAQLSGYSPDRLRHKVAAGEIPNAGRKGAPRVRRGDLPTKRRKRMSGFDPASAARDLLRIGTHA
jgi:hypothetical protein